MFRVRARFRARDRDRVRVGARARVRARVRVRVRVPERLKAAVTRGEELVRVGARLPRPVRPRHDALGRDHDARGVRGAWRAKGTKVRTSL